jgi:hypothetical protein
MAASRIPPASVAFIDSSGIDALLAPLLPEDEDRAFVVRCILSEGPLHHRGANFVLVRLLAMLLEGGVTEAEVAALRKKGGMPVPMRVPPHLARPGSMMSYPLDLPTGPLDRLAAAGSPEHSAMAQCLMDGPPQHALANATMMWLIGLALERAGRGRSSEPTPSGRGRPRASTKERAHGSDRPKK